MAALEAPDLSRVRVEELPEWSERETGKRYSLDNYPLLQIHLFTNSYTVLWPGEGLNQNHLLLVGVMARRLTEEVLTRLGQPNTSIEFNATVVENGKTFFDQRHFTLRPEDVESLPAEVRQYYSDKIPDLIEMRIDIKTNGVYNDAQIWMDGLKPESGPREVGVNIPSGLFPLDELTPLVQRTSTLLGNVETSQLRSFLEGILPR